MEEKVSKLYQQYVSKKITNTLLIITSVILSFIFFYFKCGLAIILTSILSLVISVVVGISHWRIAIHDIEE